MLCDKCKANQATINYQIMINGNMDSMNLCTECAGKLGIKLNLKQNELQLNDFIASIFGSALGQEQQKMQVKKCPTCGHTLADYNKTGLLGCDQCYNAFRTELEPVIRKMHGNNSHVEMDAKLSKVIKREEQSPVGKYKDELKEAIRTENFELAAELRDKIKVLEQGVKQDG